MTTQPDPNIQANVQTTPQQFTAVDDKLLSPTARIITYCIVVVGIIVLGVLGFITKEEAPQWLYIAACALGLVGGGLALANRPQPVKVIGTVTKIKDDGQVIGEPTS